MKVFDWKSLSTWPRSSPIENIDMDASSEELYDLFTEEYTHIKMYHACRPIDINSYYEKGILVANYKYLIDVVLPKILDKLKIEIDKKEIEKEVIKLGEFHNNSIFLALDDTFIIENTGHYLIYGSEYLSSIINSLDNKKNNRLMSGLKNIGTPTMFILKVPIHELNEKDVYDLVNKIYNSINENDEGHQVDFTFQVCRNLEPNSVISHYHPMKIQNPFNMNEIYTTII